MDRRLFVQSLSAFGTTCAPSVQAKPARRLSTIPNLLYWPAEQTTFVAVDSVTNMEYPKVGLIAVGGISNAILNALPSSFKHLHRTIAINTDANALERATADQKILIGGFSFPYHDPNLANRFARLAVEDIAKEVDGLDLVLLVAGLGGGAGTGISPVVAEVLRSKNILTLGCAVMPFSFESPDRHQVAQAGICDLALHVDGAVLFRNSDLETPAHDNRSMESVMSLAPSAILSLSQSITNSVAMQGLIGIDLEDIRRIVLSQQGQCAFGYGSVSGVNGAIRASELAIGHPFLGQDRMAKGQSAMVTIEAPPNRLLVSEARSILANIRKQLPVDADVLYGCNLREHGPADEISVTILVSGLTES